MLIKFTKNGDIYEGECSCGEKIYTYELNPNLRCKECLKRNNKLTKNKEEMEDITNMLNIIVSNICKKVNYE